MSTYPSTNYRPGSSSSKYIPEDYDAPTRLPQVDGDRQTHLTPPPRHSASMDRPYTPPNPEQYSASPSYRAPLYDRPANPDVQAIQEAAGYGSGRRRSSGSRSRSRAPSNVSTRSHHSHHSHYSRPSQDARRASHDSHRSHRSHHSPAARSHHSSGHKRSGEEPYRTESERQEYIKGLKRINSTRPT